MDSSITSIIDTKINTGMCWSFSPCKRSYLPGDRFFEVFLDVQIVLWQLCFFVITELAVLLCCTIERNVFLSVIWTHNVIKRMNMILAFHLLIILLSIYLYYNIVDMCKWIWYVETSSIIRGEKIHVCVFLHVKFLWNQFLWFITSIYLELALPLIICQNITTDPELCISCIQ